MPRMSATTAIAAAAIAMMPWVSVRVVATGTS
jgi:hypothetical protein